MGAFNLISMLEETDADIRTVLSWHLTSNHYPPVPTSMIDPCLEAIALCEDDNADALVSLPEGTLWRNSDQAPAWALVDGLHLEHFLGREDY
jgi:hypothetical protein